MKNLRCTSLFALAMLSAFSSFAATPVIVESARAHAAAGSFGCTVTGVSTANPGVVTCAAAHGLIDGDQIQITGVVGATQANVTGYAKVTGASTTTFKLYSDAALSTGVNVTGTYDSAGLVSIATDISGWKSGSTALPFTVRLTIYGMTAAKNALVCVQDSVDGFAADIVTLGCANVSGAISSSSPQTYTWPGYQMPSARFGVTNGRIRLNVQSIGSAATVTASLQYE